MPKNTSPAHPFDDPREGAVPTGFKGEVLAACVMAVGAANGGASAGVAEDAWTLYALMNDPQTRALGFAEAERLLRERDQKAA